ncbi:hypothetical protein [Pelosinus propionicus]|uniref:Uncharacterized protein n=1 Tax=Pelosinus propionicus DSM 13327 TaxID=1123291 RepID=A0A1I4PTR0_9FIRM|nr:hypothetical protein [Pelosinus propionicus]SFM31158.1 hypothetical protein SAMN04490355_107232 [Pelosinus propionicus DSM 13327]
MMSNEEILEQLLNKTSELVAENNEATQRMKEVYGDELNHVIHSPPDQSKYYYPTPPNESFTGTGIPKDSNAGQQLKSLIQKRILTKTNIQKLNIIKINVLQNPTINFSNIDSEIFTCDCKEIISAITKHLTDPKMVPPNFKFYDPNNDLEAMSPDERRHRQIQMRTL